MIRSLPDLFETPQQTSRSIGDLFVYGLPLDYYKLLPAKIEAVDSAETGLMAKKHIDTGSMIVVLVGDRSRIEPGVRQLNLGPIEIRDANGNL
jgi:zinc protease